MTECQQDSWEGMYRDSWGTLPTKESYEHPAKFAKNLIFAIVQHALDEGFVRPGDAVVDPFAGVSLGALPCLLHGLKVIHVELEPKFHALAQANVALWHQRYGHSQGYGQAILLQGDSRQLVQLIEGQIALVCSSPPYAGNVKHDYRVTDEGGRDRDVRRGYRQGLGCFRGSETYGHNPGNLGSLPDGTIEMAMSSPPYAASLHGQDESTDLVTRRLRTSRPRTTGGATGQHSQINHARDYGSTPGQLAALPEGQVDMAISSPPYAGLGMQEQSPTIDTPPRPGDVRQYRRKAPIRDYGTTPGQLAALPEGHITCAISSPPYADGCTHTGGTDPQPQHIQGGKLRYVAYGETPGQLADAVVSSPPYEDSWHDPGSADWRDRCQKAGVPPEQIQRYGNGRSMNLNSHGYGATNEQLGSVHADTFWKAARTIVEQTFQVLRPGGHAIWVVKNYVRNSAIVDFTGDWAKLCQHVGFEWLHHHRALLTEAHGTQRDLFGADQVQSTAHISFFRRLHQAKYPHLAITHESVLCFRKPALEASDDEHDRTPVPRPHSR